MARAGTELSFTQMQKTMLRVDKLVVPVVTDPESEFWTSRRHSDTVCKAPACWFVGGWYDLLLRETVADYHRALRSDGDTFLTIGPWTHFESLQTRPAGHILSASLNLFDAVMKKNAGTYPSKPVSLFVMEGHPRQGEWRCEPFTVFVLRVGLFLATAGCAFFLAVLLTCVPTGSSTPFHPSQAGLHCTFPRETSCTGRPLQWTMLHRPRTFLNVCHMSTRSRSRACACVGCGCCQCVGALHPHNRAAAAMCTTR